MRVLFTGDTRLGRPILEKLQATPGVMLAGVACAAGEGWDEGLIRGIPRLDIKLLRVGGDTVRRLEPDVILNFNSTVIFPREVLDAARLMAVNFHPGPLPEYAGSFVYQWGLIHGETQFGVTIHRMTDRVDAGDILAEERFPIMDRETGLTLYLKTISRGIRLLTEVIENGAAGKPLGGQPQDLARRRFYPAAIPLGGVVNFGWKAKEVVDFIRALSYRPLKPASGPPVTFVRGRRFELVAAERTEGEAARALPGEVLSIDNAGITIATGEGTVRVTKVFLGGKVLSSLEGAGILGLKHGMRLGAGEMLQ